MYMIHLDITHGCYCILSSEINPAASFIDDNLLHNYHPAKFAIVTGLQTVAPGATRTVLLDLLG